MEKNLEEKYDIMDVSLLAGKIMLESGAETNRVEDTMMRIASSFGIKESHSYVTPTGIMFSIETAEPTKTKLIRISRRTTDLQKVQLVNSISRRISTNELNVETAYRELKTLEAQGMAYSEFVQILAAAVASGGFLILLQGLWTDLLPAMIAGGLSYKVLLYVSSHVPTQFFSEFISALSGGLIAYFFFWIGIGSDLDKVILGSVMPLVPGLLITNAVRDLMAGHLISGLSKGAEAFLTAFAIGSGIAVILTIF